MYLETDDEYLFRISLQFFADSAEKTEEATPKKKEDVRKKGQVAQSQELVSAVVLLVAFIGLRVFGLSLYTNMVELTEKVFNEYIYDEELFTINGIVTFFAELSIWFFKTMLPIFALIMLMAVIINLFQAGFLFTLEPIKPKFSNISPFKGIKNIFSLKNLTEFFTKTIAKVVIICVVAYLTIKDETANMFNIMNLEAASIGLYITQLIVDLGIKLAICLVFFAVVDFIVQKRKHKKEIRMTKHEIKEEYKQTEGNPQIKSKIKQKQRQMSIGRMMQNIPNADVIITNPTHFAVAIEYKSNQNEAPIVIAKGQDYLALKIKDIARQNKIEIVENKPLARALYARVEVGEAIPEELYQAVAEVLAYVYSLKAV